MNVIIDNKRLREILPQSYPFLMIDRVEEFEKGKRLKAIKNITGNEWSTASGTADVGVFPETLIVEAASQAALLVYHLSKIKEGEKHPRYILGRVKAEFNKSAEVGDQLSIEAFATKMLDTGGYSDINVMVDSEKIATVEIVYSVKR